LVQQRDELLFTYVHSSADEFKPIYLSNRIAPAMGKILLIFIIYCIHCRVYPISKEFFNKLG